MRHRHRPGLKPTERLVLVALTAAAEPLSVAELWEATGSAPTTIAPAARAMERRGFITRQRISGLYNYSMPAPASPTVAATEAVSR